MRRQLLLSTVAAVGLCAVARPASAADLAVAPAPVLAPVPVYNWTGWYVGGNLGGTSARLVGLAHASPVEPFTTIAGDFLNITDTDGSFIGGGQVGFNWQFGRWVLGAEGDLDATGVERTIQGPGSSLFVLGQTIRFKNDWQASLRARTGIAFDRWLAYATGGVAWAGVSATGVYVPQTYTDNTSTNMGAFTIPGFPPITVNSPGSFGSDRHTLVGSTAGAGVEYALTDNVSFGVEYRYTRFGENTFNVGSIPLGRANSDVTVRLAEQTSQITARLNIKYGGLYGIGNPAGINGLASWWNGLLAAAPARLAAEVPAAASAPFTWTGWYAGGNAGGQSGKYSFTDLDAATAGGGNIFALTGSNPASAMSGGQVGFNWQIGPWVLGVEGDADHTDVRRDFMLGYTPAIAIAHGDVTNDWQASVRARGGIAFDRWLVYATGGVGFAGVVAEGIYSPGFTVATLPGPQAPAAPTAPPDPNTMTMPTGPTPPSAPAAPNGTATHLDFGTQRRTLVGGTVGGGVEYALSNNISVGVEYRYSDFGHATFTNLGGSAINTTTRVGLETHQVTGRLNVKLGGLFGPDSGSGPLLAQWWSVLDPNAAPRLAPPVVPVSPVYGGAEYLMWWVKDAPLSVPLVSTGPRPTTHHGFIHSYDTTILYGAHLEPSVGGVSSQSLGMFNGTRLTLGYWLDDSRNFAVEGSGFMLQTRSATYEHHSDTSGSPIINIPVYNMTPYSPFGQGICPCLGPGEDGYPPALSDPSNLVGGVKITSSLRLWGADASGVVNVYRSPSWDVSAIGGFRYVDLSENFNFTETSVGLPATPVNYAGQSGTSFDVFQTRNQFFGANLGLRGKYAYGPLSVETTGRVGLGVMHQSLNIYGFYQTYNFKGTADSFPDGIYAMTANTGRYTANEFAVVPEAQVKLGYDLTPALRLSAGYDILYESSVVRPGDQINRNLPKGQTFHQATRVDDPAHPAPLFNRTDFFAHGLTIGLSYSY